jgi:hypothetical protein
MTTATSTRGKTEFLVTHDTSSKELFDQLNELNAGKGPNTDLPIHALHLSINQSLDYRTNWLWYKTFECSRDGLNQ